MTRVLMIEDDLELAEILMEYLEQFDINITIAEEPYIDFQNTKLQASSF